MRRVWSTVYGCPPLRAGAILAFGLGFAAYGCAGPDPSLLERPEKRDAAVADGGQGGAGGLPDAGARPPSGSVRPDAGTPAADDDAGALVSIDCGDGEEFAVCTRPHADSACVGDECLLVRCLGDFVDCDGDADNGCETTLTAVEHCGRCGAACDLANVARHRCEVVDGAGHCEIEHTCAADAVECADDEAEVGCKPGFGDCDGDSDNGCETPLDTNHDCGGCGVTCKSDATLRECVDGRCNVVDCAPGFGDCDGSGCKSLANDAQNCGACGSPCPPNADVCAGGRCTGLTCTGDLADCNGEIGDDCEADLTSVATCGSCDNACPSYAHASAGCSAGNCGIDDCDPGYDDCDGNAGNGCEVDLGRVESCGSCGVDCTSLPHVVSASCGGGVCTNLVCESGFDDCNGKPADGCERSLNTVTSCGACDRACNGAHAEASCSGGSCMLTSCEAGWDDCNGEASDGCEASLSDPSSCGGCGNDCGSGSACVNNACQCSSSAGCPTGLSCCTGGCVNTHSDCFPWPCIPGTVADAFNCGACGRICGFAALFCCLIP